MVSGELVSLRPVIDADIELLEQWENDPLIRSEYNNFGFTPVGSLTRSFAESGLLSSQRGMLMVVTLAGDIAGHVSYHPVHYGPQSSMAYNIGIELLPEYRGRGYGTEAQKLLAAYLLSTYPVMRIEASTDPENIPEQRSLEKAGFTREGITRKAQWRGGAWHDLVVYSKLRGE